MKEQFDRFMEITQEYEQLKDDLQHYSKYIASLIKKARGEYWPNNSVALFEIYNNNISIHVHTYDSTVVCVFPTNLLWATEEELKNYVMAEQLITDAAKKTKKENETKEEIARLEESLKKLRSQVG